MTELSRRRFVQAGAVGALTAAAGVEAAAAADASSEQGAAPAAKFRLGLVTYNLAASWDLPTILRVCKNVGVSPVELRTTHKHGVEPTLGSDARKEIRSKFADSGVDFWGCGSVCEFHSPDRSVVEKNIETCKRFVQLAADLGGKGVKVRPNGLPKEVPVEKTLEQIGKALVPCGKAAADAGIEIWVEVHGPGTSDPAKCRTIMEQCGHPSVGLTWNSNGSDVVKGSVKESFEMLRPWVRSCHINELYKDSTKVYPYRELFRLFRQHGYDRVTMCEVGRGMPDAESGQELLRYYKAVWGELVQG